MLLEGIKKYFSKIGKGLCENLLWTVEATIKSGSANTSQIALVLSRLRGTSYKTSDMFVYRLLSNVQFKVGSLLFRCYIKLIMELLKERKQLKKGDRIDIQIDFTSDRDHFLILVASVLISNKAIPLYFSLRNYPKKKGQYNQKKMESAFIQALRYYLPYQYHYVIVADRGFGNDRFIKTCEAVGFDYVIRLEPNLKVNHNGQVGILSTLLNGNGQFEVTLLAWNRTVTLLRNQLQGQVWFIVTSLSDQTQPEGIDTYANRFAIEKLFQDLKSSGFDLECTKITQYSRFKRLFFICCLSYSLMVLVGDLIVEKHPLLKKNSPLCTSPFIAFCNWPDIL